MTQTRAPEFDHRFWLHVDQSAGPDNCWPWTAYRSPLGYGRMTVPWSNGTTRGVLAHRYAYESAVGLIPAGHGVLHSCDNPPCCNPAHLRAGTHAENMADMHSRGRAGFKAGTESECPSGHTFDAANTLIAATGKRRCRECLRLSALKLRQARRAEKPPCLGTKRDGQPCQHPARYSSASGQAFCGYHWAGDQEVAA